MYRRIDRLAKFCSPVFSGSDMVRSTRKELITAGHYTHKQPEFYLKVLAGLTWSFYSCCKDCRQCWSPLYKKSVGPLAMSRSRRHSLGRTRKKRWQPSFFTCKDPVAHTTPVKPSKLEGWTHSSLSSMPSPESTAPSGQRPSDFFGGGKIHLVGCDCVGVGFQPNGEHDFNVT